jgi:hypothetical protein
VKFIHELERDLVSDSDSGIGGVVGEKTFINHQIEICKSSAAKELVWAIRAIRFDE